MRLLFNRRPGITGLFSAFCVILVYLATLNGGVFAQAGQTAIISTDKGGYLAGETVLINGTGFGNRDAVTLKVTGSDGAEWFPNPVENTGGKISASWTLPENAGNSFTLSAPSDPEVAPVTFSRIATVTTDKADYHPGETAHIRGAGFWPVESVMWQVMHDDGTPKGGAGHDPEAATIGDDGTFTADWYVNPDDSLGSVLRLIATGANSGLTAMMTFTDLIFNADSGGQNDIDPSSLNNQSDLSAYGVDGTGAANVSTKYGWKWDEPALSGNNSQDVCVYLSSTTSGASDPNAAEYAICYDITTDKNGVVTSTSTTTWSCPTYSTADASSGGQKCFGNSTQTLPVGVTITATPTYSAPVAAQFATDPDQDAQVILDVTANLNLSLINICSKKSASPASDSSDCGLERAPAFLKLVKFVQDGTKVPADWTLYWDGTGTNDGSVTGDNTLFVPVPDGSYTLSESTVTGYEEVSLVCSPTAATNHTVTLAQGVQETCTFTNKLSFVAKPALSLVKTATPPTYSKAGDTISYSYVVTNTGNVAFAGPVTVTDDKATVTCPSGGLALSASMTCTASYTITQADIDSGSVKNTAQAHANGTDSNFDDETVTAVKNPALSITKVATEQGFSAVGDLIHYTIVAKNTGNTTLSAVTVTDAQVSDLVCTPANGSSLAPGATLNCTASHTIVQADIDAGSFYNQACVDDGTNGAAQQCADVTTPGTKNPALEVTKVATESGFSAVGDLIHYTIVAKNTGNTTLSAVTVTDAQVSDLVCTPANGSSLAPGATLNCTASHTIVQADIDAGSFYNQACVDDGTNGAAQQCADVTTPGTKNPALEVTKVATESGFSAVGDLIHYTIVAKNTGNTTLSAVTVTDAQVSDLVCTPANGSSLVPGASLSCTATHTITQVDLDAGSFYNQACVDDGTNGAAPACNDVTTPGTKSPALSLVKTATPSTYSAVGDVINYSYLVKNIGNVTLAGPVTVTDDKATVTCPSVPAGGLAPTGSITCTASYTITQGDLDNESVTNTAQAHANGTNSNQDSETVNSTLLTAQITPTATTCEQFASGTSPNLDDLFYGVRANKINSVSPGVMFYYNRIVWNGGSIEVKQSNILNWKVMDTQQLIIWDANCNKTFAAGSFDSATGTVTFTTTGLTAGATYYISVKYSPGSLVGQSVPQKPTDVYTFLTYRNGVMLSTSQDSVNVKYRK